ncbi:MAG: NIPSNAP family protein, partial [Stellaceae bacterium]
THYNKNNKYIKKWESLDDRAKRFAGFQADPEWVSGRAETEKNGQIVASITNTILQPTTFSSVK